MAPARTRDPRTGIGRRQHADRTGFLHTGPEPDGDSAQGATDAAIGQGRGFPSDPARAASAADLQALPPLRHAPAPR